MFFFLSFKVLLSLFMGIDFEITKKIQNGVVFKRFVWDIRFVVVNLWNI